jgi:predicted SAM-dependent methyltransferase
VPEPSTFYKSFSEKKLTTYGSVRRGKIEQHRLRLLHRYKAPPGEMFEIGPGHGTLAEQAVHAGWKYTAIEASPILVDVLKKKGLRVIESWTPPLPLPDASADVVYADQVLEHMSGIDAARQFAAEAHRAFLHIERSIGVSTGFKRDALAAGAVLVNFPGINTLARRTGTEDLLFKIRKNLFETLTFVARKPVT